MILSDVTKLTTFDGSENVLLDKSGVFYKASFNDVLAALPNTNGVYPDVPLNRVRITRLVGQASTVVTLSGNTALIKELFAMCFPALIDRNAIIAAHLNGNDVRKTVDGLTATLDDWTLQCMSRMGGWWKHYSYNASTNEKYFDLSPRKVKGYKYVRRRFLAQYGGTVESHDGKNVLISNSGKFTTQNISLINLHTYAKNLGDNFRNHAVQDQEVYRDLFWLMKATFNSQSVFPGITCSDAWWQKFDRSAEGGASSRAQFHKTGDLNDIAGHEGQRDITVTNSDGQSITVHAYKFLWIDHLLGGPYWLWCTGYLKKNHQWFRAKDINTVTGFDPTDTSKWEYLCNECEQEGYILEDFEDTLIPTMVGGDASKGHADYYYRAYAENTVYIPAVVGGANSGSFCGVSRLNSNTVASYPNSNVGGALAADDPTDTTPDGTIAV